MGIVLSPTIGIYLGRENGAKLIMLAAAGTTAIFFVTAFLATVIKRDISGWSKFLMVALLGIIVASVANIWLQLPILAMGISAIAVMLFSAFLLFDLKQVIDGGETNYVIATLNVYLDLLNIFQHLLSLLGGGDSD